VKGVKIPTMRCFEMYAEEKIKEELEEIKYYNLQKEKLDAYMKELSCSSVLDLLERYSRVINNAPIKLYHVYVGLYVKGWSQGALAREMGYTRYYVNVLNVRLIEFLQAKLEA
jgi:hypothetical protein